LGKGLGSEGEGSGLRVCWVRRVAVLRDEALLGHEALLVDEPWLRSIMSGSIPRWCVERNRGIGIIGCIPLASSLM